MSWVRIAALAGLACIAAGCTSVATYRSDYVTVEAVPAAEQIAGKALVVTSSEDDAYVFAGHPTSFTGGASTLKVPLGMMTREIAVKVCAAAFSGGAEHGAPGDGSDGYVVSLQPKVLAFEYGYPQLKNLGFAITPEARLQIQVRATDAAGRTVLDRSYDSGVQEGGSYMLDFSPEERVSKLAHQSMYSLLRDAVRDLKGLLATPEAGMTGTAPQ